VLVAAVERTASSINSQKVGNKLSVLAELDVHFVGSLWSDRGSRQASGSKKKNQSGCLRHRNGSSASK
jgi:hypothetical protein